MRKICLLAFALLFFLSSFSIFFNNLSLVFAKTVSQEDIAEYTAINYDLPYPGLLPDSPLYFLRVTRDRIVSFLISDPKKKTEFDLLQADKRLNAGIYLFDSAEKNEKKIKLAVSTVSKAENYFYQALRNAEMARREGAEMFEIVSKLKNSSIKHQEVLKDLEKRSSRNFKADFNFQYKRAVDFEKEINSLMLKE